MDRDKLISTFQQIKALTEECLQELGDSAKPKRATQRPSASPRTPKPPSIDFDKPLRPFIKQYAKGMSGSKKFTLLFARLVKGNVKKEVQLSEVEKHWNKMTSLMGMDFNRFFPAQAKDNDWVESKRKGFYNLRPAWKGIFSR